MKDKLGDRMKQYEASETERHLMPGLPIYIRLDGRCFTKFTASMEKPFDKRFAECMIHSTRALIIETQACIGYTQSDEISLVLKSLPGQSQYFNYKIIKMTSILASLASSAFLIKFLHLFNTTLLSSEFSVSDKTLTQLPLFDCRVINLPSQTEVANMILWREIDATRNCINSAARSVVSHSELQGKNQSELQEILHTAGVNFNDLDTHFKRGTFLQYRDYRKEIPEDIYANIPKRHKPKDRWVLRRRVEPIKMPIFRKVINRESVIFENAAPVCEG